VAKVNMAITPDANEDGEKNGWDWLSLLGQSAQNAALGIPGEIFSPNSPAKVETPV
jgi:hypothetical protein